MQAHAYVEAFAAKGVLLWREGDSLKFDAPVGVLTPAVLEKLREAKPKILPLLPTKPGVHEMTQNGAISEQEKEPQKAANCRETPTLEIRKQSGISGHFRAFPGIDAGDQQGQVSQNFPKFHTALTEPGAKQPCMGLPPALFPAGDRRQTLLDWVGGMSAQGGLSVPTEAIALPSGQSAPAGDGAVDWFLAGYDRAVRLQDRVSASPRGDAGDAPAALTVLRADLLALAKWFSEAWRWRESATQYSGAACLLPTYLSAPERRNPLLSDVPRFAVGPDRVVDMTKFLQIEACQ